MPGAWAWWDAWRADERARFFHAAALYSRQRPDLVAAYIGTRGCAEVCDAFYRFDRAARQVRRAERRRWGKRGRARARRRLLRSMRTAHEVSDAWVQHEEEQAAERAKQEEAGEAEGGGADAGEVLNLDGVKALLDRAELSHGRWSSAACTALARHLDALLYHVLYELITLGERMLTPHSGSIDSQFVWATVARLGYAGEPAPPGTEHAEHGGLAMNEDLLGHIAELNAVADPPVAWQAARDRKELYGESRERDTLRPLFLQERGMAPLASEPANETARGGDESDSASTSEDEDVSDSDQDTASVQSDTADSTSSSESVPIGALRTLVPHESIQLDMRSPPLRKPRSSLENHHDTHESSDAAPGAEAAEEPQEMLASDEALDASVDAEDCLRDAHYEKRLWEAWHGRNA